MANELQYYANPDTDTGQSITAKVYDDAGSQVGSDVVCTEVGTLAIYHGDMPTASAGVYTVRFFESSSFVAQGTIEWGGGNEITNVALHNSIDAISNYLTSDIRDLLIALFQQIATQYNFNPATDVVANVALVDTTTDLTNSGTTTLDESDIHAALTSYTGKDAYKADVSNLESRAEADAHYQNLIVEHTDTQTMIDALNDFDPATQNVTLSSTTQAAIATAVEQAILDEDDGNQILNAIVGAIGNSNVDEIALVAAIRSDLERSGGTLDGAAAELTLLQQVASVLAAITQLNNFDPANDTVANVALVDTTTTNTDMRGTDGASTVDPDNTGIGEIKADAVNSSLLIERIIDILEADETFDIDSGKARKLLRGTTTVLLEKDVSGSTLSDSVEFVEP